MSSVNSASPIGAVKNDIDYSAASLEDQNSYLLEAELLEKASSQDQNSNSSYSAAQEVMSSVNSARPIGAVKNDIDYSGLSMGASTQSGPSVIKTPIQINRLKQLTQKLINIGQKMKNILQ
jgi:hypothetical protein